MTEDADRPAGLDQDAGETGADPVAAETTPSAEDSRPGDEPRPGPSAAAQRGHAPPRRLSLELDDPWASTAGEDRPEAWGDPPPSDRQRLAEFRENRPPHHG